MLLRAFLSSSPRHEAQQHKSNVQCLYVSELWLAVKS